ncbi:13435_t:CDS:2, partial [Acaulospora morrowiae]
AHTIALPPKSKECFFEDLREGDKMFLTFQIDKDELLDVEFKLYDPSDTLLIDSDKQSTGTFTFFANSDGRYTYCFDNAYAATEKTVSFTAHGGPAYLDKKEIRKLAEGVAAIRTEQDYIIIREKRHRYTAESTNDRVKWWSIFQCIMLIALCFWQ